jgi:hypothetical protein
VQPQVNAAGMEIAGALVGFNPEPTDVTCKQKQTAVSIRGQNGA